MAETEKPEGMLGPYRVLDLTNEKGPPAGSFLS